jgi:hypothetical protein
MMTSAKIKHCHDVAKYESQFCSRKILVDLILITVHILDTTDEMNEF